MRQLTDRDPTNLPDYTEIIAAMEDNLLELDRLGAAIAAARLESAICVLREERIEPLED